MIYLDYAANTPVCDEALTVFADVSRRYIANPNSPHEPGRQAKARLDEATGALSRLLGVRESEIIYTSGASEANNLAIKGAAQQYKARGKHIVTTYLEHSSVSGAIVALQNQGFEVDFVDILPDGRVDVDHLSELLRNDTILLSACAVDSEVGLRQDLPELARIAHGKPHCLFHVDATQAMGKIPVSFEGVDLATFAPHKFYGLNGVGVLIRKEPVLLEPLIHGGVSTTAFRSGTPALGLIASTAAALETAQAAQEARYAHVEKLNILLRKAFKVYSKVSINSTARSIPHILNLSIPGVKTEVFAAELDERGFALSTKSACCAPGTVSRAVYALTKDKRAALCTLRISLSHLTSEDDIAAFLTAFDDVYRKLAQ